MIIADQLLQLDELAAADKRARIRLLAGTDELTDHSRASRDRQFGELFLLGLIGCSVWTGENGLSSFFSSKETRVGSSA